MSCGGQVQHAAAVEVDVRVVSQHGLELLAKVEEVPAVEVGVEFQVLGHERSLLWAGSAAGYSVRRASGLLALLTNGRASAVASSAARAAAAPTML